MLLQNKKAVICGGGGAIGGAVARAFAREGAMVFLAGRTLSKLARVAKLLIDKYRYDPVGKTVFSVRSIECSSLWHRRARQTMRRI